MKNTNFPIKGADLIAQLTKLRLSFSTDDADLKIKIIEKLKAMTLSSARQLIDYHEALCFIQAYPDNSTISRLIDSELQAFAGRIEDFRKRHPNERKLDDTGIVDTPIFYPYNLNMVRWLQARFGPAVDIDWKNYNEKETDPLCGMLPLFALYLENDGIDDEDSGTGDWVRMARGNDQNTLSWLISQLDNLGMAPDIRQYMYDNSELPLRWDLGCTSASRTLAKLSGYKNYYHRGPLKKARIDLNVIVNKDVPELTAVSPDKASEIIDILIKALLPRHRELFPAAFANPNEVYITSPGHGLDIYILGMRPESRMPLESNYAALLIKNGVPIGYGIAVLFFQRCELAINVFDTFRSGEAASIFEHFTKIFYHHFGGRDFIMRKWQVGYENDEGIKSGSYWFYYKLGFRSIVPAVDALASKESQKIRRIKNYRSSVKTLKMLAVSDMYISPGHETATPYKELSVIKLGFAVTKMIADRFDGDRQAAQCWSIEHTTEILDADLSSWPAIEKIQFERFAPLLTLIKDLDNWAKSDKDDLISIIKSKAAIREIDYIQKLQKLKKLEAALRTIEAAI